MVPIRLNQLPCTPCGKSELELSSVPPTQVTVLEDYVMTTGPKSSLDGGGPLEFEITASGEDYLDLSRCYLKIKFKVVNEDGTSMNSWVHKADGNTYKYNMEHKSQFNTVPVNLMLHSMFRQVDFSLNDTLVTSSNDTYPFRAYLTTMLSYGEGAKKTFLEYLEYFYWDDHGEYDATSNLAIFRKNLRSGNSASTEVLGRLHVDMCMQERLIPNNVTAKFTLYRSDAAFCLLGQKSTSSRKCKVVIEDASLQARRVKLAAGEQLRLEKVISTTGARYPVTHVVTKHFTVASGASSVDLDAVFTGQIPNKIVMGMIRNDAFTGTLNLNPFHFQHFKLTSAHLVVDGKQLPSQSMHCDFENDLFTDLYHQLFEVVGPYPHDWANSVTSHQFKGGSAFLAYDLSPDGSSDGVDHVSPRRNGTVKASFRFKEALPHTVTIIVLGQFDNTVVIDRNRAVIFDYTA